MMKRLFFAGIAILALMLSGCQENQQSDQTTSNRSVFVRDSADQNNDFYDNEPFFELPGPDKILVGGEVEKEVWVDLSKLTTHSVQVRETHLENGEVGFTGAYRYDGPSLFDVLKEVRVAKRNAAEFPPIIDQYVVIYGSDGDSVTLSWGELYYPVHLHEIIIAERVMRIVPSKTGEHWPLPEQRKLVVASDLVTVRNISEPARIMIRSCRVDIPIDRSVTMWSDQMVMSLSDSDKQTLTKLPAGLKPVEYNQVFYGRGMGIHGISTFRGAWLKEMIQGRLPETVDRLRNGMFVFSAIDGYRCSVTWSEMMNRCDGEGVILIDQDNYEGAGRFSCLFTADYFSDRAMKSITDIRLIQ
ncbi:MAG: hypothetical protein GX098_02465 [Bacteroidales bacterium]|nr:hypothetical protein [Bacteroidales bacterium]